MKTLLFIISCLLASFSYAQAQEVEEIIAQSDSSEKILRLIPSYWGSSSPLHLDIIDARNKKVLTMDEPDITGLNEAMINISDLKPGTYTIEITINGEQYSTSEVEASFLKTPGLRYLNCVLTRQITHTCPPPSHGHGTVFKEPVVYLYPKQAEDVSVKLDFKGSLMQTIPAYNSGWVVNAQPDGTLTDKADGKKYPYLFWEGASNMKVWSMDEGFVVRAGDSKRFLDTILPGMGLNAKETADFIQYWLPKLMKNPYNLIHFVGKEYEQIAKLDISPKPDAELILIMVFQATESSTKVRPQPISNFTRKGFTVVEWGGTELEKQRLPL